MKNKILTISIIFILLTFVFINTNVFAGNLGDLNVDITTISHTQYGYVIYKSTDGNIYLACSPDSIHPNATYTNNHICFSGTSGYSSGSSWITKVYKINSDNSITFIADQQPGNSSDYKVSEVYYSDRDIYTQNKASLFFLATPIPDPIPETLAGVLEMSNPTQTFQTMMRGIIPYLIALVVGLVAFWKAWQLLLKELRKA